MSGGSRNERFVAAAKRLLTFQLVAAAGAAAVTGWAVLEVRDLVNERDSLAARVAELQGNLIAGNGVILPPEAAAGLPETALPTPLSEGNTSTPPDAADNRVGEDDPPPPSRTSCELLDGTGSECALPLRRVTREVCLDVRDRRAFCPDVPRNLPDPPDDTGPTNTVVTPPPPQPARECQSVERRPIVCVPPYVRTPVPGVCIDGNRRPMRCPRGQRIEEPAQSPNGAVRR
ncbi:hypothetical protein [Allosphingosinicella sp.]|uniref:hypothetical protein n=1 Tax=Allosphingosinicella sp. TaxID=2823234 RepID=UPI002F1F7005